MKLYARLTDKGKRCARFLGVWALLVGLVMLLGWFIISASAETIIMAVMIFGAAAVIAWLGVIAWSATG